MAASPSMKTNRKHKRQQPQQSQSSHQAAAAQGTSTISPVQLLRQIFVQAQTTSPPQQQQQHEQKRVFCKPSEENIQSYDLEAVRAIRSKNLPRLQELHQGGKNLNACNQFGESLLHMACRRGDLEILKYMIHEAHVVVDIADDFGRNPLHDAAWTPSPNFDVMDLLMEVADPCMFLAADVRGSTPFDYARKEHWASWIQFLESRKDKIAQRIRNVEEVAKNDGIQNMEMST